MNDLPDFTSGIAVGIGLGWLNATMLQVPGWVNIAIMGLFVLASAVSVRKGSPA